MSKPPKVSIIIPCYNEEMYIADAINSVLAQSEQDFEIIVVDNNSKDYTAKIVNEIKDKRISLIQEEKQGLVYARNRGFREAKGEWVLRMDADARLHQSWLEHTLKIMEHENAHAGSSYAEPYEKYVPKFGAKVFNFMTYSVNHFVSGTKMLFGSAMIMHKDELKKVLEEARMRNDIWEDLDIALTLKDTKKVTLKDTPVYISLRRFYSPLSESIKYVWMWTKTYWYYSKLQSIFLAVMLVVLSPLIVVFTYFGLSYIPKIKAD